MTEEEKLEAKEQLKSLHQAYSDLTQQCSDQTPSAKQVRYWTSSLALFIPGYNMLPLS
jgi:hypothetical protein